VERNPSEREGTSHTKSYIQKEHKELTYWFSEPTVNQLAICYLEQLLHYNELRSKNNKSLQVTKSHRGHIAQPGNQEVIVVEPTTTPLSLLLNKKKKLS